MESIAWNISDFLVNAALGLIMFGIGLSLTLPDFKNIFVHPKSLIIALGIQLLLLPSAAFLIAFLSPMNPEMKTGLVLVALCASGASSNLVTHMFRGNVALAISMTSINSFVTLFTIPLLANLALIVFLGHGSEIILPVGRTIFQIFLVTLIPASAGLFVRHIATRTALSLEKPLKFIMPAMLAIVFSIKIFSGEQSGGTGITHDEILLILPICCCSIWQPCSLASMFPDCSAYPSKISTQQP
jgi:bile acid:Na+ symporter, BASS family